MIEEIIFKPIGYIKSPYEDVKNMPKSTRESGDIEAEIVINEEYLESMSSMKPGEEYLVLFYFHKSKGFEQRVPFRGNGPIKGLFSTHAPNRPNPIGVSTIKIKEINGNVIKFTGVDMLNGTPVLDIKDILWIDLPQILLFIYYSIFFGTFLILQQEVLLQIYADVKSIY